MAQSDHGQVVGFAGEEQGFAPILLDQGPVNRAEILQFQEGILACSRHLAFSAARSHSAPRRRASFGIE